MKRDNNFSVETLVLEINIELLKNSTDYREHNMLITDIILLLQDLKLSDDAEYKLNKCRRLK